jgi:exopolysaccharide biosynthesis polyprenyl glycosylphosphotransferase
LSVARRQVLLDCYKLGDLLIMVAAFTLAAFATQRIDGHDDFENLLAIRLSIANFVLFVGLLIVWHAVFSWLGLYRSRRLSSRGSEALDVVKATLVGSIALFNAAILFDIGLVAPRFLVLFWGIVTVATVSERQLLRSVLQQVRVRGRNLRNVLIAGTNERARGFARKLQEIPSPGYRILGYVDDDWSGIADFRRSGERLVASFGGLKDFLRRNVVDEVVIALPLCSSYQRCSRIVGLCEEQGITVRFLSDIFNLSLARSQVEMFRDEPIITLQTGTIEGWPAVAKRLIDLVLSSLLLLLMAPVLLFVALLVRLDSPGPVFFVQQRVGLAKRRFRLFKFRTMVADAERRLAEVEHLNEVSGPVFKIHDDPRVTRLGRFLRKASLDELPQLINVFRGDMSLVGPRPLPIRDYEGFHEDWHRRRFSVRPGVTCLWQVAGRSSIPFERWMELDMQYIDEWSLGLDLKILALTIPSVIRGRGAA